VSNPCGAQECELPFSGAPLHGVGVLDGVGIAGVNWSFAELESTYTQWLIEATG
jgi:hypothetical protein